METSSSFSFMSTGESSKQNFTGTFKVKTILTRREMFMADQVRRDIIGPNAENAMPALNGEAFMLGQIRVRILDAPKWFIDAKYGLDLEDGNVIAEIFELCMKASKDREDALSQSAQEAVKTIKLP